MEQERDEAAAVDEAPKNGEAQEGRSAKPPCRPKERARPRGRTPAAGSSGRGRRQRGSASGEGADVAAGGEKDDEERE